MLMIKIRHISDASSSNNNNNNIMSLPLTNLHHTTLLHKIPSSPYFPIFCNLKGKQGFPSLSCCPRLPKYHKKPPREFAIYSGVEPAGVPPSGPPNILWIVGVALAVVVPLISYKWGPTLKNKMLAVLQVTEDMVEAVEKVAEDVEKVAENISDNLPATGKFKEAVDFVENFAERAAKDAGAVDDFIDKVQEHEEEAESLVESVKDESRKPAEKSNRQDASNSGEDESNGEDTKDQNLEK